MTDEAPIEAPPQDVAMPILPTEIQIGLASTADGPFVMLNVRTMLGGGIFALDRAQTLHLGSELIKMANAMPSPKQLLKAQKRLIVPT